MAGAVESRAVRDQSQGAQGKQPQGTAFDFAPVTLLQGTWEPRQRALARAKNQVLSVTYVDYSSGSTTFGEIASASGAPYNQCTLVPGFSGRFAGRYAQE